MQIGALVVLIVLLWSHSARADITLPFSTTFDCTASVQNDWFPSGSTGCDGINAENDAVSGASNESAINASANYPSGGGGLGFNYWVNDSNGDNSNPNDVSSYLAYDFADGPHTTLYIRWHFRHEAGLNLDTSGGSHKALYFNLDKCQNHSSGCYALFHPSELLVHVGGGLNYSNNTTAAWGWDDLYPPNGSADGEWHCSQLEVQTNSGTGTDGVAIWTIDGTVRLNRTDIDWNGTGGFDGFTIPSNGVFDTRTAGGDQPMYMYIDDVAIRTDSMPACATAGGGTGSVGESIPQGTRSFAPMINLMR